MKNKYGAIKVKVGDITFDSKAEHKRWLELRILERAGEIEGLECHPVFDAIVNRDLVCKIELDFRYYDKKDHRLIYEDVKASGTFTPVSRLKHKLLHALFPEIEVRLVWV